MQQRLHHNPSATTVEGKLVFSSGRSSFDSAVSSYPCSTSSLIFAPAVVFIAKTLGWDECFVFSCNPKVGREPLQVSP